MLPVSFFQKLAINQQLEIRNTEPSKHHLGPLPLRLFSLPLTSIGNLFPNFGHKTDANHSAFMRFSASSNPIVRS